MEKQLKIAIVGVGGRGLGCFGEILKQHKECEISALCDVNSVRLMSAAKELQVKNTYLDLAEMLQKEKLDGLVITTPDYLHETHVCMALNAGLNVLVDKPLAISVKGCQKMLETAQKTQKTIMIGFNLRHHIVLRKLKSMVEKGDFGRIFLAENREFYDGGRTYMARWNGQRENCGSLWIHKGSHDFDIFNWLFDFPKPVKVSAFARMDVLNRENLPFPIVDGVEPGPACSKCNYLDICPDQCTYESEAWGDAAQKQDGYVKDKCIYTADADVHDNGIAVVEYENGIKASHLECFITSCTDRKYTIVGTRGMAEASLEQNKIVFYPRWSSEVITHQLQEVPGSHGGADPELVATFLRVMAGKETNTSTASQGMWASAIGEAAELSRNQSRVVFLDELFQK